ncbi:DUF421 domain-containing protein [Lysinibacillus yapensis]|uniref:DUF421 domain-containing protein n=1 Tax=Ureibacillus yapensis TaxID=2304605 RepID=A0A396SKZ7_9BACL|nr:YetF domain-containing protein [Lysinibacillus yapensis]RHW35888.1 DUF421 domain-containing protein [Lysinibacillus yapensis]
MFFSSWQSIASTIIVGILAYISLIILLRISGKRTLSEFSAFDLVVSVAIGSVLSTIMLDKQVKLADGITAMAVLIAMQYMGAWLAVRSKFFEGLIKATPELLYYNGEYFSSTMKKARIQEEEILQAARSSGIASMMEVEAVVLESNGNLSVIQKTDSEEMPTIRNVEKED